MGIRRHTISTKRKVQFWWEVYRVLLKKPSLREALGLHRDWHETRYRYRLWGKVAGMQYEDWWKQHSWLFIDRSPVVRVLKRSYIHRDPNNLYLELNMRRSPTHLLHVVRYHLREKSKELKRGKSKKRVQTAFAFTLGAEIRPAAYVDYIRFLKDVYAPNFNSSSQELLKYARKQFGKRKGILPSLHLDGDQRSLLTASVSVHRYRDKVRRLCRAVAAGEFPGRNPNHLSGK
jgi:hypothetical protein